ncbi:MAG: hypothetical protein Q9213_001566 [Squamulea squamosa]
MAPEKTISVLKDEGKDISMSPEASIKYEEAFDLQQYPIKEKSPNTKQQYAQPMQYPDPVDGANGLAIDDSDRLCFFYGSLMDSGNLAWVLGLGYEPYLRPANIDGYRTMLWGPFPALIRADSHTVFGMAYNIEVHAELTRQITGLHNYEGEHYGRHRVRIRYDDGSSDWGWTFLWQGDDKELKEGEFNLKAWREHNYRYERFMSESPPMDGCV